MIDRPARPLVVRKPGPDGLRRKIHDQGKQFRQGPVAGQFASGVDQGPHLRRALHAHDRGLVQIVARRPEDGAETGDHGGGAVRELLLVLDEHHGVLVRAAGAGEFDGQVPRGNAVARPERHRFLDTDAVQQRTVLAAQILHGPLAVAADDRQMLARKPDVVGVAQLICAGAAECDAVAIQGYGGGLALQVADDQFPRSSLGGCRQGFSVSLLRRPRGSRLCIGAG